MLSRTAENLYWMGRYLQRTEHQSRLMGLQVETLIDKAVSVIAFGWQRLFGTLDQTMPTTQDLISSSEDFLLADSFTLSDYMTFDRENPDSIRWNFYRARENARQIRHCLTQELWSCLNLAWLRIREQDIAEIWASSPSLFYRQLVADMYTVSGAASATMYRDQGWLFLELGRWLEQVQQLSATMFAHETSVASSQEVTDADWLSLLRLAQADEIYEETFGLTMIPDQVYRLLVTDPLLPGSLAKSLGRFQDKVECIGRGPTSTSGEALLMTTKDVGSRVTTDWPQQGGRSASLEGIQHLALTLNDLVYDAYFSYENP